MELAEDEYGPYHEQNAMPLNNLAALYRVQGRYVEAVPLLDRVRDLELSPDAG